ncbi:MAG TPA: PAS domain S-box protein [Polyangiaceae bacterium]|nr:PAS domain S-box protein [Polyangiaceae bacterium]
MTNALGREFADLLPQVLGALAADDPKLGLEAALEVLAQHGVIRQESPDMGAREHPPENAGPAHYELEHHGHRLSLIAARPGVGLSSLDPAVRSALRLGLMRAVESQEREQLSERYQMLSAASFEGIIIHADNGVAIEVNQRLAELVGYEPSELLGNEQILSCIAAEDLPVVMQRLRERVEGAYVVTGVRKDGSRFRAELSSKQGKLGQRPVRVVAVRDVTEFEQTNALLRESERRLRDLAAAAFDYFAVSRDGMIIEMGGRVEQTMGYAREQLIGKSLFDLIAPAARAQTEKNVLEGRVFAYETAFVSAAGEIVPVSIQAVPTTFDGQPARFAGIRDLRAAHRLEAERRRLEQQIERSQRLDSLGVLTGGIAHDFNNLLVGILGNADLLLMTLTSAEDRESALAIRAAGERAADLTRQMLAYAGQRQPARNDPVDFGELLRELKQLLSATLSKKMELELSIEPGCSVLGDRATLTQVVMNLLTNASDALGGQPGKVQVRVSRITRPDARWDDALGATIAPGAWVLLEVTDNGVGMDAATRDRVFEPFFSTKDSGHGLGLAACLGIVSSHKGAILVESALGRGSRFSVLLPASEHSPADASVRDMAVQEPCKVLVVDDEQLVRAHLRRALELRGYRVDEASSGEAGLARFASNPPDVIVLDYMMGDTTGIDVIRRIRETGSRVPIVLSSGYLDASSERNLDPTSFQVFLRKPYRTEDLMLAIEQARALAAPRARPDRQLAEPRVN